MTLFDLIPPIPQSWKRKPYVIIEEGVVKQLEPVIKKPKKANCYRDVYQEDYRRENREKLNQKRREWYQKIGKVRNTVKKEMKRMELLAKVERGFQGES